MVTPGKAASQTTECSDKPKTLADVIKPQEKGFASALKRPLESYLKAHDKGVLPCGLYDMVLREVEKPLIEMTLKVSNGKQSRAAAILGLNRNTLRKKIQELDICVASIKKGDM